MAIRVMIVEDERLFRDLLKRCLEENTNLQVVAAVGEGKSALSTALSMKPDVVLMDIELGQGPNGIEVGLQIKQLRPETGIVLLTSHKEKEYLKAIPLDRCEGWSYLLKQSIADVDALARAVEGAASGLFVLDPELVHGLRPRKATPLASLTHRQQEVLELVAQGYSNPGIAEKLHLSVKSVENQLNTIYQVLDVNRDEPVHPRVKAVLAYLEWTRPQ